MKIVDVQVPSNCEIALAGDFHTGSAMSHEDGIVSLIDWLAAGKSRRLFVMGDWIEGRLMDDPKFDFATVKIARPLAQRDYIVKAFKPVKKQIDLGLAGNHDMMTWRFGNVALDICKALSTPHHEVVYGTYVSIVRLADKHGPLFNIYLAHGFRELRSNAKDYEQQIGNMKASFKLTLRGLAGDCLVMATGHTHKLLVVDPSEEIFLVHVGDRAKAHYLNKIEAPAQGYIPPDQRWYANTGSYQKLYSDTLDEDGEPISGYAEKKGYRPTELGHVELEIHNRRLEAVRKVIA